ncbi:hypothetical protein F5Y15DRAFT_338235 [Xylariaceae sp. FL0016]|nr:hypothetical protein F5Y15DRAFT_338235 [Xylariaceae sp. FL0016]
MSLPAETHAYPKASFGRFRELPTELRLQIWKTSLHPRVIEVHRINPENELVEDVWMTWGSECSNPAIFSVSRESRTVAKSFYTIAIPANGHSRTLFLNPIFDTVIFLGHMTQRAVKRVVTSIKSLDRLHRQPARIGFCFSNWFNDPSMFFQTVKMFNLDEVVLVWYNENVPPATFHNGQCELEDGRPYGHPSARARRSRDESSLDTVYHLKFIPWRAEC